MGTCRTKERAPTLAATTGIALGTDAGLQLFTTGKLAAVGELSGVGEGPGLGDELVVEPTAEAVGSELTAEDTPGGGLTMVLSVPLAGKTGT